MNVIRITLVADGSSDRALLRLIEWVFFQKSDELLEVRIANGLPPAREGLSARVRSAVELFPCEILVVHRDAENCTLDFRLKEVAQAAVGIANQRLVPLVPVRMTEAWLLGSERSIREAAGNPNGRVQLHLPDPKKLSTLPNPKDTLYGLLRTASELSARRLQGISIARWALRVADLMDDWSHLSGLDGFDRFVSDMGNAIELGRNDMPRYE